MSDQGMWFKLWCSAVDDTSLDNLAICDFGRWAKFGAYLKKHGNEGTIAITSPARTLCSMLQVSDFSALYGAVSRFPNVKIEEQKSNVSGETTLIVSFCNWAKYQGDFSTQRVRKFREMKRSRGEEKRGEEKRGEKLETTTNVVVSSPRQEKLVTAIPAVWPEDGLWLKEFLEKQTVAPSMYLLDSGWWKDVSTTCGGIELDFLETEFARMSAWLTEDRTRSPASKTGWKRFVRRWLERAHEKIRKNHNVQLQKPKQYNFARH